MRIEDVRQLDDVAFGKDDGLVPVVAQHAHTGEILMLAWANRAALERTLESGGMWYFSRSRGRLWRKGETSGNEQAVVSLHLDCDGDAVLARVIPAGPACHTGDRSCFAAPPTLVALADRLDERRARPEPGSHTARLLGDRNLRLKKLGEEAAELVIACADSDRERAAEEAADVVYHAIVACLAEDIRIDEILDRLERRLRPPSHR